MEKLEIYKNMNKIGQETKRLPIVCETVQKLYEKVNSNGLTTSYEDLKAFIETYIHNSSTAFVHIRQPEFNGEKEISIFLKNIVIDSSPEGLKIMGIKMNRDKMADLIEIDVKDITDISGLLLLLDLEDSYLLKYLEFNTEDQQVKLIPTFFKEIENKHTVFADTEKQIKITKVLLKVKEALNEYIKICSNWQIPDDIDGLNRINGEYELDAHEIKNHL